VNRAVAPPSGWPPPTVAVLAGRQVELVPLAERVADRYFEEFPEDAERYGAAARAWEIHDTLHCLRWAILDVEGLASLGREIDWLAKILQAREFPLEHLARNLELAADVVAEQLAGRGLDVARRLRECARSVRAA